jgi:hypothetical protein
MKGTTLDRKRMRINCCTQKATHTVRNSQIWSCLHSDVDASNGQYGHLNDRELFFDNFMVDCFDKTCPHGRSIGGLSSLPCSRSTGQTNTEWNWNSLWRSSGNGTCFIECHSLFAVSTVISLRIIGNTWPPAATVIPMGPVEDWPFRLQNCWANSSANVSQFVGNNKSV